MRMAHDGKTLYMIVASQYSMFGKSYYNVDGEWYYLLDNIKDDKLKICKKAKFPKESAMSLQMNARQDFAEKPINERTITFIPTRTTSISSILIQLLIPMVTS